MIIEEQGKALFGDSHTLSTDDIHEYSYEFLELFVMWLQSGAKMGQRGPEFRALEQFFTNFARQIQARGGSLDIFVRYVQALQRVLIEELEESDEYTFEQSREVLLVLARLFNQLVLDVFHIYLEVKEQTIKAQQEELKHTSTPITEIWDGVLTLPIIGTLDSSRTMTVMENLLSRIEKERAKVVVLDVTGVMAIDSQVSHHLIQMVRAVGLMGAKAILTGIRPEIARAITSLNIDLSMVSTRATLSEGLKEAFELLGIEVSQASHLV
ncbi:STAS domain-containing protein [Candidatus Reidiella endopervernicosa]|uniref:STAS domain-containing protein n=2 Tax=Gammaproteobacteria incertae sedis TaxID=118884 RepID=A0A6N0HYQ0_9GAMM|nr:STAS domain-containing protein [Candidatus Reidiella endopervernicosa]QKQ27381.1 STAS domain-containing protein [Candidatus Reidiella endopervernicosa]